MDDAINTMKVLFGEEDEDGIATGLEPNWGCTHAEIIPDWITDDKLTDAHRQELGMIDPFFLPSSDDEA